MLKGYLENQKLSETDVGLVKTQYYTFMPDSAGFVLESGDILPEVTIAFETYGELNPEKTNAILILHALTGDAHAAGYHKGSNNPGWWNDMIGPQKAFDTDQYFIICSNVLGGCKGSTGPSSINPVTQTQYGIKFPVISIGDMVNAQVKLIDHLGIPKLLSVAGGSMGGMQVLEWMFNHSDRILSAIPISIAIRHSPQQIAFNEVGRQAIMSDPKWNEGDYYSHSFPSRGLAVARMIGHITYMSDKSMATKFGRRFQENRQQFKFNTDFEVEGYLHYRGKSFVGKFDANSYLYITKAMDLYDLPPGKKPQDLLMGSALKVLAIAFKSDWLYPVYQTKEIVHACKLAGLDTTYCEIESDYGHDAFLLEIKEESHLIKYFLDRVHNGSITHE
jgi:homoserine O-acetyltransferase/O-succinyltransferase